MKKPSHTNLTLVLGTSTVEPILSLRDRKSFFFLKMFLSYFDSHYITTVLNAIRCVRKCNKHVKNSVCTRIKPKSIGFKNWSTNSFSCEKNLSRYSFSIFRFIILVQYANWRCFCFCPNVKVSIASIFETSGFSLISSRKLFEKQNNNNNDNNTFFMFFFFFIYLFDFFFFIALKVWRYLTIPNPVK